MTTITQKMKLNNCTHEQLFKAISKIQAKGRHYFCQRLLLNPTYTCPATGNQIQVPRPSITLKTITEFEKIISEEIENDIRSERKVLGPRSLAFPALIDCNAEQALVEKGPDQQEIELFDCKATPLTPASNGALQAP